MQLEQLCDVEWRYELQKEVEPTGDGEGRLYGQGVGTLSGRLSGLANWSNFPRLQAGFAHPDARGAIEVTGGGLVLFTLTGLADLSNGSAVHVMKFTTQHEPSRWLNTVIALGEGSIDPNRKALFMRYYTCTVDHRPAVHSDPVQDR